MTISKLPSGRWRAQIWHQGTWLSVPRVIGGPTSYRTKTDAKDAKAEARRRLKAEGHSEMTVAEWRERWLTDALFQRPAESTRIHLAERTRAFTDLHGDKPLRHITDLVVSQWIADGKNRSTVPALRAMFSDACKAKAGRRLTMNPFAGLGLEKSRGNQDKQPPTEDQAWTLIHLARDLTPPSFAAYLEFACFSACRPGELDALQWTKIDWANDEVLVDEQWNVKARKFTAPKHRKPGAGYLITLTDHARNCLLQLEAHVGRESAFCFTTLRGNHYTPSTRNHHWNRVRAAAGLGDVTLYLATRHYFGWYAVNVLGLDTAVVAEQLGHQDGGKLVERLYGHPDKKLRRNKIRDAYREAGKIRSLDDARRRKDTA